MKKLILGIGTCLALSSLLLTYSCNKTRNEVNKQSHATSRMFYDDLNFTDFPKIENGMLSFRDQNHFEAYLAFIDSAVVINPDTTTDDDDVLNAIERQQGFTSLRAITHADYLAQEAIGFPGLKAIPDEHFILAKDTRSVLNSDMDVKIADKVIHFVNKDYAVAIDAAQTSLIQRYHALNSSATVEDLITTDATGQYVSIYELNGEGITIPSHKPTGVDEVYGPDWHHTGGCANKGLIEFRHLALKANGQWAGVAYFDVDWGDNTTHGTFNYNSSNTVSPFVPNFSHQYGNNPSYTVFIKGYYAQGGPLRATKSIVVTPGSGQLCGKVLKDSQWQYAQISSGRYIGGRIYLETFTPFLGTEKMRIIGMSKLVRDKGNGNYEGFKGHLYTYMKVDAKDENCNLINTIEGQTADQNKKDHSMHREGNSMFYWNTATSQHSHTENGNTTTVNITLDACH